MKKSKQIIILALISICYTSQVLAQPEENSETEVPYIFMADPFVLEHQGIYYLYGTKHAKRGIQVYQSTDMDNWTGPVGATDGFALAIEDVFGEKAIMGAYVVHKEEKFYFFYVATDRPVLSVAVSDSPLGPFKQVEKKPLNLPGKSIAPHVFTDDDGRSYMYYTKLQKGNKIFVAEMEDDLLSIKENTAEECLRVTETWEHTEKNHQQAWSVAEGAAVLKHKEIYYLFYTANHYLNPDYNVGYATSPSPTGPWKKYKGNPILKKSPGAVGIGSGEFIVSPEGELLFFYHAHFNKEKVSPRKVVYSKVKFVPDNLGRPDVVKIDGERIFPQIIVE